MNNDIIPLLQASVYLIVAVMFGLMGLYFYLLRSKISKDRRNSKKNKVETKNDNYNINNDEDDLIQKF